MDRFPHGLDSKIPTLALGARCRTASWAQTSLRIGGSFFVLFSDDPAAAENSVIDVRRRHFCSGVLPAGKPERETEATIAAPFAHFSPKLTEQVAVEGFSATGPGTENFRQLWTTPGQLW